MLAKWSSSFFTLTKQEVSFQASNDIETKFNVKGLNKGITLIEIRTLYARMKK